MLRVAFTGKRTSVRSKAPHNSCLGIVVAGLPCLGSLASLVFDVTKETKGGWFWYVGLLPHRLSVKHHRSSEVGLRWEQHLFGNSTV